MRISFSLLCGSLLALGCSDSTATDADSNAATGSSGGSASSTSSDSGEPPTTEDAASDPEGESDASSGDTTAEPVPYQAGTRLRAVLDRSADGEERFSGWHDTEIGQDCFFLDGSDGESACTPVHYWREMYADEACTELASPTYGCEPEPPQFGRIHLEDCGGPQIMERGEAVESLFALAADGSCNEATGHTAAYRLHPVADGTLLRASVHTVVLDGGLARREIEADDGSTQWVGPFDPGHNAYCTTTYAEAVEGHVCLADRSGYVDEDLHRDAACGGGGVARSSGSCSQPRFTTHDTEVYTVIEQLEPEEVWRNASDGACEPIDPTTQHSLHAVRPFEATDAPQVGIRFEGAGRLKLRQPETPSGEPLGNPEWTWWDSELQTECYRTATPDGDRCIPTNAVSEQYYADPDCGTFVFHNPRPVVGPPWYTRYAFRPRECPVHEVVGAALRGAPYEGDVYQQSAEGCTRLPAGNADTFHLAAQLLERNELAIIERSQL